jgi:hypothetical protein
MTLVKAPGGQRFVDSLIEVIKTMALLYAGTPDDKARQHLESYIGGIETAIVEAVGATKAPIVLDGMQRAILTRKREIEAAGASRA